MNIIESIGKTPLVELNKITEKINNKEKTTIWVPKIESRCFQIVLSNVFVGSNILWLLKIEYALNILNILKSTKLRKKKF